MLAHRIGSQLPRGSMVLEVAPGPGYFCIELAKLGPYPITGLDISHTFLEMAAKKAAEAGVQVDFRQGTASKMPFASNVFDFLRCRAAFKNFAEPVRALEEMCRVLKPGGRGLIIELRHDASPESINRHMDGMGLSAVNRLLTKLASGPCCSSPPIPRSSFSTCCRRPQNHQPLATSHGGQRPPYFPGPDFATIPAVSSIVRN